MTASQDALRPDIRIIAFKGCLPALQLHDDLRALQPGQRDMGNLELVLVPSPEHAGRMRLHGSPTIFAGHREFQARRKGPAGFY